MRRALVVLFSLAVLGGGAWFLMNLMSEAAKPPGSSERASTTAQTTTKTPAAAPQPSARTSDQPRDPKPHVAPEPAAPISPVAAATTGTLRIDCDVPGADVFIDRKYVGAAPVTATEISPGSHRLNVSARGYDGVAEDIDVEPGPRDITIRLKEVKLDLKIQVIHKHKIGSCTGTLSATPQAVRYETSDKNDGFDAPLLDIENIYVDYLAKILKLKLRGGRNYDFTDPQGNADRLFNFQHDVTKAIEKLKKGN